MREHRLPRNDLNALIIEQKEINADGSSVVGIPVRESFRRHLPKDVKPHVRAGQA